MTKQDALSKAADAVQMMHVALGLYGETSAEFEGAAKAAESTIQVARAYGATDSDLRQLDGAR